ncbi:MAG: helix-turn-helix transcriptional regulator [Alphaproteobacteria bacterium]|nr:helix-turn-helix transcriptional regulator [Alphaproteobacteria bacterium]
MFDQGDILEIALRGGAAGISFLLALVLVSDEARTRVKLLGALFSFSIGVYVLVSGAALAPLFGPFMVVGVIFAIAATVFFWWFAAALFDDNFRWRWWRVAPLIVLLGLFGLRAMIANSLVSSTLLYIHLGLNAVLFADVFRIAIVNAGDDLVDPRRRFRFVIAIIIALFGIGVAAADLISSLYAIPQLLFIFHAASVFTMNMVFGVWILTSREALFAEAKPLEGAAAPDAASLISAADRPAFERLEALMADGVYRQERLTVAVLAEKVGVPEHQLRKLINGGLGFRNFSAFLNQRRIDDAKRLLGDPANARRQVLQIALDLGYGSIAPFNRAFKNATGKTPTEFRKDMLDAD